MVVQHASLRRSWHWPLDLYVTLRQDVSEGIQWTTTSLSLMERQSGVSHWALSDCAYRGHINAETRLSSKDHSRYDHYFPDRLSLYFSLDFHSQTSKRCWIKTFSLVLRWIHLQISPCVLWGVFYRIYRNISHNTWMFVWIRVLCIGHCTYFY